MRVQLKIAFSVVFASAIFAACQKEAVVNTTDATPQIAPTTQIINEGVTLRSSGGELKVSIKSTISINQTAKTATLPLHRGMTALGAETYYIITEASTEEAANRLGVNYSPRLKTARGTRAVQKGSYVNNVLRFAGTVNFAPQRSVSPNPTTGFPPVGFAPGSVGDANYSPLVELPDGTILNAAQIANATGTHDRVVNLDRLNRRATLELIRGFYNDKEIFYIVTEASADLPAALEASTFASNLNAAPSVGVTASGARTSRSGIILVVNGAKGVNNPMRQGLESALMGEGEPLNALQEEPSNSGSTEYSPLWDAHMVVWKQSAISAGLRERITDYDDVRNLFRRGLIEAPSVAAGPANPDLGGLKAAGFVINCPVVAVAK